jgi:hypothetical protein
MRKLFILSAFMLFLSHPFIAVAVESQSDHKDALTLEVIQMTQSLDELIQLIKSQQSQVGEYQKLQTAISYLSFRSRTIETMQYDLRYKKGRRDAIESNIERIKDDPEAWDKYEKRFQPQSSNLSSDEPKPSELRLKLLKTRFDEINSEIIALETEIQGLINDLATFESYVQERLGFISSM